jgi:type IV pilus assembly protein PilM
LKRFFKPHDPPMIGLDMDALSLKWVELAQDDKSQLVLERCALEPLQAGWLAAGHIAQFDEVAAALRRLLKTSGSRTRAVALAMPDAAVMRSKIRLPTNTGEAELQRQVAAEAERLTGRTIFELNLDHTVLPPSAAPGASTEMVVWIAAVDKEKMQDRLGLAESAGLQPVVMDAAAQAAMLAVCRLASMRPAASASAMVALCQVGNEDISLHVSQRSHIAQALRQAEGLAQLSVEDHQCPEALADSLLGHLNAFLGTDGEGREGGAACRPIDAIFLAGESWLLPGLQQAIGRRTVANCVLADPFSGMRLSAALPVDAQPSTGHAAMLTACGLALRRFHGRC